RADDEDEAPSPPVDGRGEETCRLVQPGYGIAVVERGLAAGLGRKLVAGEKRAPTDGWGRVDDGSVGSDQLGEALALLDESRPGVGGERAAWLADERREILRAQPKILVERMRQVRCKPLVEKR